MVTYLITNNNRELLVATGCHAIIRFFFSFLLAISNTLLLTVYGAPTTSSSSSIALPWPAIGGETLGRTCQLLLVTRSFLFAHHAGLYNATFRAPSLWTTKPASIPTANVTPTIIKPGYTGSGSKDPTVIPASFVVLVDGFSFCGRFWVGSGFCE